MESIHLDAWYRLKCQYVNAWVPSHRIQPLAVMIYELLNSRVLSISAL
jgi:hypothetical protein